MSRCVLPVVALVAVAACKDPKGVEVDGRLLIPADATLAVGFDVGALRASPLGPMVYAMMQSDADIRATAEAVQACKIDTDSMRGFFAGDPEREDRFVVYIEGANIGASDSVRCIEKEYAKATGEKDGLLLFKTRGDVQTLDQKDGSQLILLNRNAMVLAEGEWEATVFAAIEQPDTRNTTSGLAKVVASIDPGTDTWLAFALSDADRAGAGEAIEGGDGMQAFSATVDLASGVNVVAHVDGRDAANAKVLETGVRAMIDEAKPGLADAGLSATMLDGAKVSLADARVTVTLGIGADALPGLMAVIGSLSAEE